MHKNSIIKLYLKFTYFLFLIVVIVFSPINNYAQIKSIDNKNDETRLDSLSGNDILSEGFVLGDTIRRDIVSDSLFAPDILVKNDSVKVDTVSRKGNSILDSKVVYEASDSIVLSNDSKKVFLYKKAKVEYESIVLEADYIEYDQQKNIVFAKGVLDSAGVLQGKPKFKENDDEFLARTIKYNFKTKQGYIEDVFTEEQESFLHSERTKKLEDNSFLLGDGKYTTCDLEHPHFYLHMTQAKVVPNDKIISGPAYLVMFDIPIKFIGVPFALFPNKKELSSGLIVPKYGEERRRGFFLREGGYYFRINDRMDLAATGEIYSKGSWGGSLKYRYVKRYKFSSSFNFMYTNFKAGEIGEPDYRNRKDMRIQWTHSQDSKANPSFNFSASVDYSTSSFDELNSKTVEQRINNQKSSSISLKKNWIGRPFHLTANLRHSQNTNADVVNLTLPTMTFNVDRQYPFKRKKSSGDIKWYENIQFQYSAKMENKITTTDTLLFNGTKFSDFENGFQHDIPLSTNIKFLKYFNISPSANYTGVLFTEKTVFSKRDTVDSKGKAITVLDRRQVDEFNYAHVICPSVSLSASPNVYGMYRFTNPNSKIVAVRHVVTPSFGISYVPDLGGMVDKYYYHDDISGKDISIYETGLYKLPVAPGESGSITLGLSNNLEMKIRTKSDTGEVVKKIVLLKSFNLNTSYNLFADTLNWASIGLRGQTTLFKNKLNLNFGGTINPYALNEEGKVINQSHWKNTHGKAWIRRLGRLERFDLSFSFKLNSRAADNENSSGQVANSALGQTNLPGQNSKTQELLDQQQLAVTYVDFDIPWNLGVDYKFIYSKPAFEPNVTQTLGLNGDFSLTENWKISFRANFDIEEKSLTTSSINIHRKLHCWEMRFSWIPVGVMQSYSFQINVLGSTLRDLLKYDKRKSWHDNL
ncbi:MAG: LPS-assembly protein LptD [Bacteroidales bacterium]|nr:LPS-assembly protein LptD [Bacteroidales bacterium]